VCARAPKITICPPHYDRSLEFDRHQFAAPNSKRPLAGHIDRSDADRMHVFEITPRPRRDRPKWAKDERAIMARLLRKHQIATKHKIASLYWLKGWTATEIAEETGLRLKQVTKCLENLTIG